MKVCPSWASGPWISSLMTVAPKPAAMSASAARLSRVWTVPVGLCGLHSSTARAPPASAASMPRRSSSQPVSVGASGTRSTTPPASSTRVEERRVDRGMTTTRSPGAMTRRRISTTPIITSPVQNTRAGSTVHAEAALVRSRRTPRGRPAPAACTRCRRAAPRVPGRRVMAGASAIVGLGDEERQHLGRVLLPLRAGPLSQLVEGQCLQGGDAHSSSLSTRDGCRDFACQRGSGHVRSRSRAPASCRGRRR